MLNSETGEREIVVGNKQLLSMFFVVVLLCGGAFIMGYVLGENSRSAKTTAELGGTPSVPVTGDVRPQPAGPLPAPPPAADPSPQQPAESSPAQDQAAANPPAEGQPEPTTQPAKELQQQQRAPSPEKSTPTAPPAAMQPVAAPGPATYWQVTATSNAAAARDLMEALKEKGLPSRLIPGRDNLIRVVVGPYTDRTALA